MTNWTVSQHEPRLVCGPKGERVLLDTAEGATAYCEAMNALGRHKSKEERRVWIGCEAVGGNTSDCLVIFGDLVRIRSLVIDEKLIGRLGRVFLDGAGLPYTAERKTCDGIRAILDDLFPKEAR